MVKDSRNIRGFVIILTDLFYLLFQAKTIVSNSHFEIIRYFILQVKLSQCYLKLKLTQVSPQGRYLFF